MTGIILGVARISGETAPLLFTALGNQFWNTSLTEPTASLPVVIFNYATSPYDDWHQQASAAGQRTALHLAADEALVGIGVHDEQRRIRLMQCAQHRVAARRRPATEGTGDDHMQADIGCPGHPRRGLVQR